MFGKPLSGKGRLILGLWLGILAALPAGGAAEAAAEAAAEVTVEAVSPPAWAQPGDLVTHVFRVFNRSSTPLDVQLEADLPPGWVHLGLPPLLSLQPGSSQDVFLTVIVPHSAVGEFSVSLVASAPKGAAGEARSARAAGAVVVEGVWAVEVRAPGEQTAFSGGYADRVFTVVNAGNAPGTFQLEASSRRGWPVSVEPATVALRPGESVQVRVRAAVPQGARGIDVTTLTAISRQRPEVRSKADAILRVPGPLAQPAARVASLPARAVLRYDVKARALQWSLSAAGALDPEEKGGAWLSVSLEGLLPPARLASLVYERPEWRLSVGEVSLREATMAPVQGYGADAQIGAGPVRWGVSAVEGGVYALRASAAVGGGLIFGVVRSSRALDDEAAPKNEAALEGGERSLQLAAGGRWESSPGPAGQKWALEAEAAVRSGEGSVPWGARVEADAGLAGHRLSLSVESREAGLLGPEGASRLSAVWLTYHPWLGNVGTSLSVAMPRELFQGAERLLEQRLHLSRSLSPALFAYAQQRTRVQLLEAGPESGELFVSAGLRLAPLESVPEAHVSAQASASSLRRYTDGVVILQSELKLGSQLPFHNVTAAVQAELKQTAAEGGGAARRAVLSVRASAPAGRSGILGVKWRADYDLLGAKSAFTEEIEYLHQLSERFSLEVTAERLRSAGQESWRILLEGAADLELPTPIPIRGSVEGKVVPVDEGIAAGGLVLKAGEWRTVTAEDGSFSFPALRPGVYTLEIENLPARLRTEPARVEVEVRRGRTAQVVIGLASTVGIDGVLAWAEDEEPPAVLGRPSLEGARVILSEGERRIAEARVRDDGSFQFADLAPGTYRLALDEMSLPRGVAPLERELQVAVGEREWKAVVWQVRSQPPLIAFEPLKPAADFDYAPRSPRAGEPVRFQDRSVVDLQRRAVSWLWSFGDGAEAEGPSAVHVYERPGRYAVRLTVIDDAGESDTVEKVVVVE